MDGMDEVSSTTTSTKTDDVVSEVKKNLLNEGQGGGPTSPPPGDNGGGGGGPLGVGTAPVVEYMDSSNSTTSPITKKRKNDGGEAEEQSQTISKVDVSVDIVTPTPRSATAVTTTSMDVDVEGNVAKELQVESLPEESKEPEPEVDLRVIYNKQPIPIKISLKKTVGDLKLMIEKTTGVAPALQKVLVKGMPKNDVILESLGLTSGSKVLVIGSKLDEVLAVSKKPTASELKDDTSSSTTESSQNWCTLPRHQKIIEKGVPEDVMPGILDVRDPLPDIPLYGMLSSKGSKLRLTFKLEADEIWIGTKERTDKMPIGSIRSVVSQPITGYEHYHILALQIGPTEASRVYIYWVPAQYIKAIQSALGV